MRKKEKGIFSGSFAKRKVLILPAFALMLVMTGCRSEQKPVREETISEESLENDTMPAPPRYVLSAKGIGPVEVGMPVKDWPEETEGLYQYVEAQEGGDANQYNFFGETEPAITVLDFGEGKADLVIVDDPRIEAQVGDKVVNMSTPFAQLLRMPGVESSWEQLDEEGMWYWKCSGLWFAPSLERLPEKLAEKLYNSTRAPQAEDFPEEVTIGYIATGLPF